MKQFMIRAAIVSLGAISLAGCIDSSGPILTDAHPVLGDRLTLQLYSLRDDTAYDPERSRFTWDGKQYVHSRGSLKDIRAFTVHPLEGNDYIVQSLPADHPEHVEYALMRKLVGGVYQVIPIDEDDADAATRAAQCKRPAGVACRIETRDQLLAFARATAAHHKNDGGLALRVPNAGAKRPRR